VIMESAVIVASAPIVVIEEIVAIEMTAVTIGRRHRILRQVIRV